MSSGFILAFNQSGLWLALTFFILAGIGDGMAEVCFMTRAQLTQDKIRLSIFSLIKLLQTMGFAMGMVICSFFFDYFSVGHVIFMFHSIPILTVIVSLTWICMIRKRKRRVAGA